MKSEVTPHVQHFKMIARFFLIFTFFIFTFLLPTIQLNAINYGMITFNSINNNKNSQQQKYSIWMNKKKQT